MELAGNFECGAAQVDITPPLGTVINGDFRAHYANYIHDPLHAKAIVLRNKVLTLAIVVVDICVMPKAYVDQIRQEIAAKLELNFKHILISSTHTHAAGSVAEAYLSAIDSGYARRLPGMILATVTQAINNLQPAKVGFGQVDVPEHVRSRRYFMDGYTPISPVTGKQEAVKTNPFGVEQFIKGPSTPTDPGVGFMAIQNLKGEWMALLANYSLHYVGDWENGTISADYFGYFAAGIKEKLNAGSDFVGIMSNGTSGDINIWEFIKQENYPEQHFEKSKLIGNNIAQKIYDQLSTFEWQTNPDLAIAYQEISLTTRKPNAEELITAKKVVATSNYESLVIDDGGLKKLYAREQVLLNEYPESISFPIQVFKIGKGTIGGLGGEIFAETGLNIKKHQLTDNYFTISMANGNCGYVPTAAAFENGGYETWRSRTSYLQKDAANILQETLLAMINQL
jgi:neutral ceramidase